MNQQFHSTADIAAANVHQAWQMLDENVQLARTLYYSKELGESFYQNADGLALLTTHVAARTTAEPVSFKSRGTREAGPFGDDVGT